MADFLSQMQAKYGTPPTKGGTSPAVPVSSPSISIKGDFLSQMQSKYAGKTAAPAPIAAVKSEDAPFSFADASKRVLGIPLVQVNPDAQKLYNKNNIPTSQVVSQPQQPKQAWPDYQQYNAGNAASIVTPATISQGKTQDMVDKEHPIVAPMVKAVADLGKATFSSVYHDLGQFVGGKTPAERAGGLAGVGMTGAFAATAALPMIGLAAAQEAPLIGKPLKYVIGNVMEGIDKVFTTANEGVQQSDLFSPTFKEWYAQINQKIGVPLAELAAFHAAGKAAGAIKGKLTTENITLPSDKLMEVVQGAGPQSEAARKFISDLDGKKQAELFKPGANSTITVPRKAFVDFTNNILNYVNNKMVEAKSTSKQGSKSIPESAPIASQEPSHIQNALDAIKNPEAKISTEPLPSNISQGGGNMAIDEIKPSMGGGSITKEPTSSSMLDQSQTTQMSSTSGSGVQPPLIEGGAKGIESLAAEARKYRNAEEFVSSHQSIYRADNSPFDASKVKTDGNTPGTYFATDKTYAEDYGSASGRKVSEYMIDSKAKVLKYKDLPTEIQKKPTLTSETKLESKRIYDYAKSKGYDAVESEVPTKVNKNTAELTIINPDVVKTKAQLIDIWNKAHETTAEIKPSPEKFQSRVFDRLKSEHPQELQGDLTYDTIKLHEDAQRAIELLAKDKQKAYRVAMGTEKSSDVTSTSVNIAMAEKALQEGNNELFAKLTKNRSLEQTRRGQEIVAEKGSVTDNSTARYVKELISTRLDKLGKDYLSDTKDLMRKSSPKTRAIAKIDAEVKKVQASIKGKDMDIREAQKLIDSLTCS